MWQLETSFAATGCEAESGKGVDDFISRLKPVPDLAAASHSVKAERRTSATPQRSERKEGGEQKHTGKWQAREEKRRSDRWCVCVSADALNHVLARADRLSGYTEEGSQQRDFRVEQMPLRLRGKTS